MEKEDPLDDERLYTSAKNLLSKLDAGFTDKNLTGPGINGLRKIIRILLSVKVAPFIPVILFSLINRFGQSFNKARVSITPTKQKLIDEWSNYLAFALEEAIFLCRAAGLNRPEFRSDVPTPQERKKIVEALDNETLLLKKALVWTAFRTSVYKYIRDSWDYTNGGIKGLKWNPIKEDDVLISQNMNAPDPKNPNSKILWKSIFKFFPLAVVNDDGSKRLLEASVETNNRTAEIGIEISQKWYNTKEYLRYVYDFNPGLIHMTEDLYKVAVIGDVGTDVVKKVKDLLVEFKSEYDKTINARSDICRKTIDDVRRQLAKYQSLKQYVESASHQKTLNDRQLDLFQ